MANKQVATKKKAAPKKMQLDGGNDMGLNQTEMQDWMEVQEELVDLGYSPRDVQEALMERHPKVGERAGSGLMASARASLNKAVEWRHVVYLAVGTIGFIGLLKLIGMAFDVNIPVIHNALNEPAEIDV